METRNKYLFQTHKSLMKYILQGCPYLMDCREARVRHRRTADATVMRLARLGVSGSLLIVSQRRVMTSPPLVRTPQHLHICDFSHLDRLTCLSLSRKYSLNEMLLYATTTDTTPAT